MPVNFRASQGLHLLALVVAAVQRGLLAPKENWTDRNNPRVRSASVAWLRDLPTAADYLSDAMRSSPPARGAQQQPPSMQMVRGQAGPTWSPFLGRGIFSHTNQGAYYFLGSQELWTADSPGLKDSWRGVCRGTSSGLERSEIGVIPSATTEKTNCMR